MQKFLTSVIVAAGLGAAATSVNAVVVYSEDWESGSVGAEWTTNSGTLTVDTAPGGQNILGRDDGLARGLSNQTVTLSLAGLASHSTVSVGFDLIVIDSMDDVEPFSVDIDGSTEFGPVFFINRIGGPTDSSDPGATGAPISLDTHMFTPVNSLSRSDAVYRIEFDATHSASTLMADFSYTGLQAINDEAWSIDNIQIEIDAVIVDPPTPSVPAPSTLALLGLGLIGVATARRRRVAIR